MKDLNRQTAQAVKYPTKVIQFGEGNFLRAFVDYMIDIANEKTDFNGSNSENTTAKENVKTILMKQKPSVKTRLF